LREPSQKLHLFYGKGDSGPRLQSEVAIPVLLCRWLC